MSVELSKSLKLRKRVQLKEAKEYAKEAVICFEAGAYRASVVMLSCAVFEHLRVLTRELGKFDDSLQVISTHIEKQFILQKAYEQNLTDTIKKAKLLTNSQKDFLKNLLRVRNNAAHASGVPVLQWEAAALLQCGINEFLSQPIAAGDRILIPLMETVKVKDLFPIDDVDFVDKITAQETSLVHPGTLPGFATQLVNGLAKPQGEYYRRNAEKLIQSLARRKIKAIRKVLFQTLMVERTLPPTEHWFFTVLASDPEILAVENEDADSLSIDKALGEICSDISEDDAGRKLIDEMWTAVVETVDPSIITKNYPKTLQALLSKVWTRRSLLSGLSRESIAELLLRKIVVKSSKPQNAEIFLGVLLEGDFHLDFARAIDDRSALEVVVAIARAAEASMPGCKVQSRTGFVELDGLRNKALSYIESGHDPYGVINEGAPIISPEEFIQEHMTMKDVPWWICDDLEAPHENEASIPRSVRRGGGLLRRSVNPHRKSRFA